MPIFVMVDAFTCINKLYFNRYVAADLQLFKSLILDNDAHFLFLFDSFSY